jgi:hypothetical protein
MGFTLSDKDFIGPWKKRQPSGFHFERLEAHSPLVALCAFQYKRNAAYGFGVIFTTIAVKLWPGSITN